MKKIEAKIIADSIDGRGNRLITYILTYPRMIHAEVMTHRLFSRNAASSRAIPFDKMVKMVEEDPFIPIAWQKDHKGMQGTEYFSEAEGTIKEIMWRNAAHDAIVNAQMLNTCGVTKQLCNRLLEPFMWYTAIVTASELENFFKLRCPQYLVGKFSSKKDAIKFANTIVPGRLPDIEDTLAWLKANQSPAEIHIQALAEAMWDARNESVPRQLQSGEWHVPFGDQIDYSKKEYTIDGLDYIVHNDPLDMIKIATARCARLSYMTHDGVIDYQKDIALHDQLLSMGHMSPFEHCAQMMSDDEYNQYVKGYREKDKGFDWMKKESLGWCNNLRGFIPYRYIVENK